jgi:hypothetical protein
MDVERFRIFEIAGRKPSLRALSLRGAIKRRRSTTGGSHGRRPPHPNGGH